MNTKRYLGVLLEGGKFDDSTLEHMRSILIARAIKIRQHTRLTKRRLGLELGIERERVGRLVRALDIEYLFE